MRLPLFSSKRLGIDLGTASCLVWSSGEGVVLSEPSVVAIDSVSGKVVAIGSQAKEMVGKTPPHIITPRPLMGGIISDFEVTEKMKLYHPSVDAE